MAQLISHLLILLCIYRSIKMFFWEWSSLNIFMLGWILSLFILVALLSSEFWLLNDPTLPTIHTIGYFVGWIYTYIFIDAFCFLLIILYVDRTEWFWGHLFWAIRESLLRRLYKEALYLTQPAVTSAWLTQQIAISNGTKIKLYLRWVLIPKYILLMLFGSFVIGYSDIPMFNLCWSHVWYLVEFKKYDVWLLLPICYFTLSAIKWYLTVVYPFANTGYKHLGLTHRTRYIFMPSSEWLRNDFIVRRRIVTFRAIFKEYLYLYEVPPAWISWKQTIIDRHEQTWRGLRMLNWINYKHWLYTHPNLIVYKYSRFDEFDFNLIYWKIGEQPTLNS